MTPVLFGLIAGLCFGAFAVLIMLPMKFENPRQAMLAAFASRFSVGFVIPNIDLPLPFWAAGVLIGLLISLSDAIVTRAYLPILGLGMLGGGLIGYLAATFV